MPQLHHLSLRYCKRLTDQSVDALAAGLPDLQTLDLSFCTNKISVAALATLLQVRGCVLTELRLWHGRPRGPTGPLVRAIRSLLRHECALCVIDLRHCSFLLLRGDNADDSTSLRRALLEQLHFVERNSPGLFTREPRGGRAMEQRYISYYERIFGIHRHHHRLAS